MNSEYSTTTSFFEKYFEFYKAFLNLTFINLYKIFYFRSIQKVAKRQMSVQFCCFFVCFNFEARMLYSRISIFAHFELFV